MSHPDISNPIKAVEKKASWEVTAVFLNDENVKGTAEVCTLEYYSAGLSLNFLCKNGW